MSKRPRRRYSPEEKAKILRLHLLEQVPISEICQKQGIHPTMFYQWQKALFENAAAALEGQRGSRSTNRQRQAIENKLKRKDEVLAVVRIIQAGSAKWFSAINLKRPLPVLDLR